VCSSVEPGLAAEAAGAVRSLLGAGPPTLLGPAPLFRLRGRERAQLVLKATDRAAAVRAVGDAVQRVAASSRRLRVSFAVDVDPQ
jgi:primosomal protein N' (replication factor Y) (superfamily II helicase)